MTGIHSESELHLHWVRVAMYHARHVPDSMYQGSVSMYQRAKTPCPTAQSPCTMSIYDQVAMPHQALCFKASGRSRSPSLA